MLKNGNETYREIQRFCENVAYDFVTSSSVEVEFSKLTGKDMKAIKVNLENYLCLSLRNWLDKNGLIEDE